CLVHTDHDEPQLIDEGVVVGHGAMLHGRRIGKDTLVGMGAILLSGCEVGAECLVAAGTLITENRRIPPRSVVMGVPGKVVRAVTARGILDPASAPAVYCTAEGRWLIASNIDSQRIFDEDIDGLGFQLKEWPWHWGREQFLADLCFNRKIACDRPGLEGDVAL